MKSMGRTMNKLLQDATLGVVRQNYTYACDNCGDEETSNDPHDLDGAICNSCGEGQLVRA